MKLTPAEIDARLAQTPNWAIENSELVRSFKLKDFTLALAFVCAVGYLAEAAEHHPDIVINYNRVRLALTTHDSGGITEKDFALASAINNLP
jgi:4a-hydroxytetrahydrobiopterin dehydratase